MKGSFESYESWNLSLEFQFSFFNSHFSILIVPWCNGSTSDFGSACPGSNPGGTTETPSRGRFLLCYCEITGNAIVSASKMGPEGVNSYEMLIM